MAGLAEGHIIDCDDSKEQVMVIARNVDSRHLSKARQVRSVSGHRGYLRRYYLAILWGNGNILA